MIDVTKLHLPRDVQCKCGKVKDTEANWQSVEQWTQIFKDRLEFHHHSPARCWAEPIGVEKWKETWQPPEPVEDEENAA